MLPKMDERGKINALSSRIAKMYTLMLLVTLRVCDFGWGKLGWAKYDKSLKSKNSHNSAAPKEGQGRLQCRCHGCLGTH